MVILRCTRDLLARVSPGAVEPTATSTTRLGDWYVALVRVGQRQCLLAISERMPCSRRRAAAACWAPSTISGSRRSIVCTASPTRRSTSWHCGSPTRDVKVLAYAAAGVKRYWLVDVNRRTVACLGARRPPDTAGASISANVLTVPDLPGFELRLDTLWL